LEPSLLNQLVCHIGSLASVYHKPPSSFVDPARQPLRGVTQAAPTLPGAENNLVNTSSAPAAPQQSTVIPSQDSLIADLLSLDLTAPAPTMQTSYQAAPMASGLDDLLGMCIGTLLNQAMFNVHVA
jgi:hypothetical protein